MNLSVCLAYRLPAPSVWNRSPFCSGPHSKSFRIRWPWGSLLQLLNSATHSKAAIDDGQRGAAVLCPSKTLFTKTAGQPEWLTPVNAGARDGHAPGCPAAQARTRAHLWPGRRKGKPATSPSRTRVTREVSSFLSAPGHLTRGHGIELQQLSHDQEAKAKRTAEERNPSLDIILSQN